MKLINLYHWTVFSNFSIEFDFLLLILNLHLQSACLFFFSLHCTQFQALTVSCLFRQLSVVCHYSYNLSYMESKLWQSLFTDLCIVLWLPNVSKHICMYIRNDRWSTVLCRSGININTIKMPTDYNSSENLRCCSAASICLFECGHVYMSTFKKTYGDALPLGRS